MSEVSVAPVRASARSRVKVARFDPTVEKKVDETTEELLKTDGSGKNLGDIENIADMLAKIPSSHDLLVAFHRILFVNQGKSAVRKRHIRAFNGFVYDDKFTREKVVMRLSDRKWTMTSLKDLCELLDLEKSGEKDTVIERIITFLEEPKASGKKRSSSKISKSGTSTKGKKKAPKLDKNGKPKKKRPLTAYFLFLKEQRPTVVKENPEFKVTEIAAELGSQWRDLPASKKKKYQDQANKLKAQFEAEKEDDTESEGEGKKKKKKN